MFKLVQLGPSWKGTSPRPLHRDPPPFRSGPNQPFGKQLGGMLECFGILPYERTFNRKLHLAKPSLFQLSIFLHTMNQNISFTKSSTSVWNRMEEEHWIMTKMAR